MMSDTAGSRPLVLCVITFGVTPVETFWVISTQREVGAFEASVRDKVGSRSQSTR
jgi:hypothetical protein